MKKNALFILSVLILVFLLSCSGKNEKELVVGMELAYPPFEMTDSLGNPYGISVDLAKQIGEKLNRPVKIENIAFDGLIPSLKSHKIDLIISSLTATEERAKSIAFSDPYLETGLCLLTSKNSNINYITDLNEKEKKVVVKKATTGHLYAEKNLTKAKLIIVDKESSAVLEVVQGKADAFIYDQMSVYKHWQANKEQTRAILKPFQKEFWAIGLRLEDKKLINQINQTLYELKKDKFFDKMGDTYLKEQKAAFKELGFPFYF